MILNCTWPYRDAQCPRSFSTSLRRTEDTMVGICEACLEHVFLCRSPAEAEARMQRGERVAKGYLLPGEVIVGTFVTKELPGTASED